MALFLLL